MRFIHTGDWHVGKTIRGRSRADEHRAVLQEIVDLTAANDIDVVLVAGDLFDTAAPSPEAEKIVYSALLSLARVAKHVVVICGNHDNPRRLEAIEPLLELTNIYAVPCLARPADGGVLTFEGSDGTKAKLAVLPFISQRGIVKADALMSGDAAEHAAEYADRLKRVIEVLCRELTSETVNVVVGHAMVHGGVLGGGERSAHTVFDYSIPATVFPASLHYVALGHLHRSQKIAAACPVQYCGSPLQLDFGESDDEKSITLVEAHPGRPAKVEALPLKAGQKLQTVRGTVDELAAMAEKVGDSFLRVDVEAAPAPGLGDRVRELLPNAVEIRIVQPPGRGTAKPARKARLGRSPIELFSEYLADIGEADDDLEKLFRELLEEIHAPDPA